MNRLSRLILLAAIVPGCNPLLVPVLLKALNPPKTENKVVSNEPGHFYRKADHHDFHDTETYTWHNCSEQALVDGEVTPSCPNCIQIRMWDSEGTLVFDEGFHAPHCFRKKKDWDPVASAKGKPGNWTIEFTFDLTGVNDLIFDITSLGEPPVEVITSDGSPQEGEEDDDPDRDGDGVDDDQQGAYVHWHALCTDGRTKAESYALPAACETASITASWDELTSGAMRVTVADSDGVVVYDHTFLPGDPTPFAAVTTGGKKGTWTVTLESTALFCENLTIKVQAALCGCEDE